MDGFIGAAAAFPTVLFTAALAVVLAFWLLVALGGAGTGQFDGDADLTAVGLGEVPVAVAASLVTSSGWLVSFTGSVFLNRWDPAGVTRAAADLALLALTLLTAWCASRLLLRPLRALFPGEPGSTGPGSTGPTPLVRTGRVDERTGRVDEGGRAEAAAADGFVTGRGRCTGARYGGVVPAELVTEPSVVVPADESATGRRKVTTGGRTLGSMSNYQGPATLIADGNEIDVVVTLSGSRSEVVEWGGSAQTDEVTEAFSAAMENGQVTLRFPDGREAGVVAKSTAIGSGRLKISGSGPIPF